MSDRSFREDLTMNVKTGWIVASALIACAAMFVLRNLAVPEFYHHDGGLIVVAAVIAILTTLAVKAEQSSVLYLVVCTVALMCLSVSMYITSTREGAEFLLAVSVGLASALAILFVALLFNPHEPKKLAT